jgi:phospholipid-translocating ATPase
MADGIYQSVMSFFIPYLALSGAAFVTGNGLDVIDRYRLGLYIAHPAIITINLYILINTYRWDWLMLLFVTLSDLFIFFWTGVYTSTTYSQFLYQAAPQVYGQLSFWLVLVITPVVCILPRFAIKAVQKVYFPYDVDIIREQITLGKFKHLKSPGLDDSKRPLVETPSPTSSTESQAKKGKHAQYGSVDEDRQPIYPPSVATHNTRAQNGSDTTNYTLNNANITVEPEGPLDIPVRPSIDRARPSFDRVRASMDRVRASFEASSDFTSAARLTRIESSHSNHGNPGQRRFNLTTVRKRGMSAFSKKSVPDA